MNNLVVGKTGTYCKHSDDTERVRQVYERALASVRPEAPAAPPRALAKRLTPEQTADLIARYRAGASVRDLATSLHVHRYTVSRYLDAAGVTRRPRSMTELQVAEAIRLYEQGLSLERVGERLGFSASCVCRAFRGQGYQTRDTHGRGRRG